MLNVKVISFLKTDTEKIHNFLIPLLLCQLNKIYVTVCETFSILL